MLPTQLLTPFQAERDHSTRDMYTYATIQVGHAPRGASIWIYGVYFPPSLPPHLLPPFPTPWCPSLGTAMCAPALQ